MISMFGGWLWVLLWESIGVGGQKDNSFISILVLIYQSSVTERRSKEWPLIAFGIVLFSGIITIVSICIVDKNSLRCSKHFVPKDDKIHSNKMNRLNGLIITLK